ncbi:MAG: phosphosulfolactate synthase [Gemmatimonadota bacterium]
MAIVPEPSSGETPTRSIDSPRVSGRSLKPRATGQTEIRGPAYTPMALRHLADEIEALSPYVDSLKLAGGPQSPMPRRQLVDLIALCHRYDVMVATDGLVGRMLLHGEGTVDGYLRGCQEVGFDIIELSSGCLTLPADDSVRLVKRVQQAGLKVRPVIGIQFAAASTLPAIGQVQHFTRDAESAIQQARRFLAAGADLIMIESAGITEQVTSWRTEVPARIAGALGLERVMFEAAVPGVPAWYVEHHGPAVNLFVDHRQVVMLECLRAGLWGVADHWGE